jgi:hypothetical protein
MRILLEMLMIENQQVDVFLFGGTAVSWLSKKQNYVARYTIEAEYISCSTVVSNAVWIKHLYKF